MLEKNYNNWIKWKLFKYQFKWTNLILNNKYLLCINLSEFIVYN